MIAQTTQRVYTDTMQIFAVKKLLFVLVFCGACVVSCSTKDSNKDSKIIFWKYNEEISFEELCLFQLEDAYRNLEIGLEIPLGNFNLYLWDEQILRMDSLVYNDYYRNALLSLGKNSDDDDGSLYFSIIINDKIVFNEPILKIV